MSSNCHAWLHYLATGKHVQKALVKGFEFQPVNYPQEKCVIPAFTETALTGPRKAAQQEKQFQTSQCKPGGLKVIGSFTLHTGQAAARRSHSTLSRGCPSALPLTICWLRLRLRRPVPHPQSKIQQHPGRKTPTGHRQFEPWRQSHHWYPHFPRPPSNNPP